MFTFFCHFLRVYEEIFLEDYEDRTIDQEGYLTLWKTWDLSATQYSSPSTQLLEAQAPRKDKNIQHTVHSTYTGAEHLTDVTMKSTIYWHVTPQNLVEVIWCFE
jgi:hypothetical protein